MYEPSVTATSNLALIALETHSVPPSIDICSQSHGHHLRKTSRKEVEWVVVGALHAVDVTLKTPGWISLMEQISPLSCHGRIAVFV
jgi:hypothetical protein